MNMNKMFKKLFNPIQAEEALKDRTKAFLAQKTQGFAAAKTKHRKYPLYAAACVCLLFMLSGGYLLYFTPHGRDQR